MKVKELQQILEQYNKELEISFVEKSSYYDDQTIYTELELDHHHKQDDGYLTILFKGD